MNYQKPPRDKRHRSSGEGANVEQEGNYREGPMKGKVDPGREAKQKLEDP